MSMSWMRNKYSVLVMVTVASVVIDQVSKSLVIASFPKGGNLPIIPGFFEIYHAHNYASAFGLFSGNHALFFVGVSLLAICLLGFYFLRLRRDDLWVATALAMILAGALGNNVFDRLRHGFVVDFIRFYLGSWSWPTFNFADISIVCGVALFAIDMIRTERQARAEQRAAAKEDAGVPRSA